MKIMIRKSIISAGMANFLEYSQNNKNKKADKNKLGPKGEVSKK